MLPASLYLGGYRSIHGAGNGGHLHVPAHHLVTHGVAVGMTGSGKTGLITVLIEETLRAGIPVLVIDVKGDLPNLLLAFPSFNPAEFMPWAAGCTPAADYRDAEQIAAAFATERQQGLQVWGIGESELSEYANAIDLRVITPGGSAGEYLHVLSSLERRSDRWDTDPESARNALGAAVSLLLRLLGRDPDPARSREHVLISVFAERRLRAGLSAELGALLDDLANPPIEQIGALKIDAFMSKRDRQALAAALNALLASPTFETWRQGSTLDIAAWMTPRDDRTPGTIVSVAHLDDEERSMVLGVLLEEILSWVRTLPGSQRLRALIVFDEVFGFLPPHPANPPTKRPLVALMKQARAFGVGIVVATQNPMDLDYRALSNAGLWWLGRLQTDADRARVLDGLRFSGAGDDQATEELGHTLKRLAPRWFVMRNAHADPATVLLQPRWTISFMRGPMTRSEIQLARKAPRIYSALPPAGEVPGAQKKLTMSSG